MMIWLSTLFLLSAPDPTIGATILSPDQRWAAVAATVRISGGLDGGAIATGVCIAQREDYAYVLSAAHSHPRNAARIFEFFARDTYPNPIRTVVGGDVLVTSDAADFVILKVKVGRDPITTLKLAGPNQRPKRFPFDAVSVGCPNGVTPLCRAERVQAKRFVRRSDVGVAFFWEAERAPEGGMSGGPLLSQAGIVIGICSAGRDGRAYFTHLDEILAATRTAGFGWLIGESR